MATIKVNGITQQSGAGFHERKGAPGRRRTRAAMRDAAVAEQAGHAFRRVISRDVRFTDDKE